jgi:hypothetical protein
LSEAIVVAAVAAWPATLAAILTCRAARAADRRASTEQAAVTAHSLDQLGTAVGRVEAATGRVEAGLADVRERVARLEAAGEARAATAHG